MKVGFIGAGRMATTIGRYLIGAGHEVVLSSSRGPKAPTAGPRRPRQGRRDRA